MLSSMYMFLWIPSPRWGRFSYLIKIWVAQGLFPWYSLTWEVYDSIGVCSCAIYRMDAFVRALLSRKGKNFFFKLEWKRNKTFGWQLHTQYNAIFRVENKWGIFYEMERKTKINLIHGMKFGTCVTECCRASLDYLNYSELKIFNSYCGGCAVFNLKLVGLV